MLIDLAYKTFMSIVIAVEKAGEFVLVADTLFEQGGLLLSSQNKVNHQKIYSTEGSYVGLVGPSVNQNIFESVLTRHRESIVFTGRQKIFESFRNLHSILKEEYFINLHSEDGESAESSQLDLLIVNQSGIYEVENHREVNEFRRFWAIGSGSKYALGALSVLYDRLEDIEEIAISALNSACMFDGACGLPYTIFSSMRSRVSQEQ